MLNNVTIWYITYREEIEQDNYQLLSELKLMYVTDIHNIQNKYHE